MKTSFEYCQILTVNKPRLFRQNQCILLRIASEKKNYEGRKQGRKGIRRIGGGKLEGNEAYIHREWEEGRYLQFRGSIHEQVGDTNLGARVTFSPSHVENARAWSEWSRLIIARGVPPCLPSLFRDNSDWMN